MPPINATITLHSLLRLLLCFRRFEVTETLRERTISHDY